MTRAALALLLAIATALGAGDWWDDDPFACPEPDQPNCGAPNGAGGWTPEPAEPATPAPASPAFTG